MTKYYIGTSGWNYSDWKSRFYPKNLAQRDWLAYYATQFNSLEVNATFYRSFSDETYINWYNKVPDNFKFVIKAPRLVTHFKLLIDCEATVSKFEESATLLRDKLGLMLLQLSPKMPYDTWRLHVSLRQFHYPTKVVVEFRDKKWLNLQTKHVLEQAGSIFCAVDSDKFKLNSWLTASTAYVRLHGRVPGYHYCYSLTELKEIAKHIRTFALHGAKEIYIFFNNDYEANAPYNALTLRELLGVRNDNE
jgi:uncharacterized protein YecE (DUF72 family)